MTVANDAIANILLKMGDKRGALAIHQNVLAEDRTAAQADPSDALLRRDLYAFEGFAAATDSAIDRALRYGDGVMLVTDGAA